jgi:hypothetical protein
VRRIVAGLSLALAAMACGGGGGDGADPADVTGPVGSTITSASEPTVATSPTEDSVPIPSSTAAAAVTDPSGDVLGRELVGRWAHYDIVAYEDGVLKTLIISYGFNDFSIENGQIVDTAQFCFSEQRTDQPIETSLSDAATQAIKPPSTPVEVDVVDGILRIRRSATPTPVGIRLDDPANESLPTDPEDPRIVDDDGDGKPGITVTIRVSDDLTGELYIARREIFAYEAFLVEPDLISGTVTDDSEQLVIGASDPVFAGSGSDWVQHRDLTKSPIILRRVEPDWDCDRLVAERDALFPPTPDVDW